MMRSMFAGVSGLKNHQTRMDVVGNNIANVNTVGFKGSRVTFAEMMSQTLQGAQAPQDNRGGINPQQIGLGVDLASIDTNQTQGSLESTGIGTDLAIDGDGFFRVNDGQQDFYTRAGNFTVDSDGALVSSSNGYKVQGWMADNDGNINTNDPVEDLEIPIGDSISGRASSFARFNGNLAPDIDERTTTVEVFNSLGGRHSIELELENIEVDNDHPNVWQINLESISNTENGDGEFKFLDENDEELSLSVGDFESVAIKFDTSGNLESYGYIEEDNGVFNFETEDDNGTSIDRISLGFNPGAGSGGAPEDDGEIPENVDVNLDFSIVTQNEGQTTVDASSDGYEFGFLDSFGIDNRGIITGNYTNGINQQIGQVGLANFSNPSGLVKEGETIFRESQNSGGAQFGEATVGGRGEIAPGTLEMSNVDLAEQFTNMIVTQRGFQANSRSITTSDEMLQELTNLKR